MKEAEPTSTLWVKKQHAFVTCACIEMVFKVLCNFFSYQSSLRLAFLLGVLYLYLGNFTLWPVRIPLSPMRISKQALNRFTPVDFFFNLSQRAG